MFLSERSTLYASCYIYTYVYKYIFAWFIEILSLCICKIYFVVFQNSNTHEREWHSDDKVNCSNVSHGKSLTVSLKCLISCEKKIFWLKTIYAQAPTAITQLFASILKCITFTVYHHRYPLIKKSPTLK